MPSGKSVEFNIGVPISGIIIEDMGTGYHEYVEIWYSRDGIYRISIIGLDQFNNTIIDSTNENALIVYI